MGDKVFISYSHDDGDWVTPFPHLDAKPAPLSGTP